MKKKILPILLATIFGVAIFIGCTLDKSDETETETDTNNTVITTEADTSTIVDDHEKSDDYVWEESDIISIDLSSESGDVEITEAGTYELTGDLDGQVIVNTDDEETVRLILAGVDITSSTSAGIFVENADKTIIVLADNTDNYITDASSYDSSGDDDEPNAAIFSKSDLTIYTPSNGSLTVEGNYNDAIASKDGLIIRNANIDVTAADDGIRGKDYVVIKSGNINIDSEGDGIKSDNSSADGKGYIYIHSGTISVESGTDAITAQKDVIIDDVDLDISSGGGSGYSAQTDTSTKGIKAAVDIIINGGTFTIDSADDSIHSNNNITINDGTFELSSGDDGMHADTTLEINDGDITITKSYEGIESAMITINDGDIDITSSDDGINVAGGNDGSSMGGRPGQGMFADTGDYYLYINGGNIYMNAGGDGLDSNGYIQMTGGTAIVDGPTNNGNGAIDYGISFEISGGELIAAGSSGMAEAPNSASTQYSVLVNFDASQSAGSIITIVSESGETVLEFEPAKQYQSIAFSSSRLEEGETYYVYIDGTEDSSFTISEITTTVGTANMMGGGRMPTFNGEMPERPTFNDERPDFGDMEPPTDMVQ